MRAMFSLMVRLKLDLKVDAFDPSIQEAEAGQSLISRPAWHTVLGQSELYIVRPCFKNKKNDQIESILFNKLLHAYM